MTEEEILRLYQPNQVEALAQFIHFRGCELQGNDAATWEGSMLGYKAALVELASQVFMEMHDVVIFTLQQQLGSGHGPGVMIEVSASGVEYTPEVAIWLRGMRLERP